MTKKEILKYIDKNYGGDREAFYADFPDIDSFKNGTNIPKRTKGNEVSTEGTEPTDVQVRRGGKLVDKYYDMPDQGGYLVESTKYKDKEGTDKKMREQAFVPYGTGREKGSYKYAGAPLAGYFAGLKTRKDLFDNYDNKPGGISDADDKKAWALSAITGAGTSAALLGASAYRDLRKKGSDRGQRVYKEKYNQGGTMVQQYYNGTSGPYEVDKKAVAGGTLSGAATGASMGATIGPWGAAIGAGVGAGVGFFVGRGRERRRVEGLNKEWEAAQVENQFMENAKVAGIKDVKANMIENNLNTNLNQTEVNQSTLLTKNGAVIKKYTNGAQGNIGPWAGGYGSQAQYDPGYNQGMQQGMGGQQGMGQYQALHQMKGAVAQPMMESEDNRVAGVGAGIQSGIAGGFGEYFNREAADDAAEDTKKLALEKQTLAEDAQFGNAQAAEMLANYNKQYQGDPTKVQNHFTQYFGGTAENGGTYSSKMIEVEDGETLESNGKTYLSRSQSHENGGHKLAIGPNGTPTTVSGGRLVELNDNGSGVSDSIQISSNNEDNPIMEMPADLVAELNSIGFKA